MPRDAREEPSPQPLSRCAGLAGGGIAECRGMPAKNPHPNPSPGARERGLRLPVCALPTAWLRHVQHTVGATAPLSRAPGEGLGVRVSGRQPSQFFKYLPLPGCAGEGARRGCAPHLACARHIRPRWRGPSPLSCAAGGGRGAGGEGLRCAPSHGPVPKLGFAFLPRTVRRRRRYAGCRRPLRTRSVADSRGGSGGACGCRRP